MFDRFVMRVLIRRSIGLVLKLFLSSFEQKFFCAIIYIISNKHIVLGLVFIWSHLAWPR